MMDKKIYLVLSTSSFGYQLYDYETKETSFHEHRRKISYQEKKIVIGDKVTLDTSGFIDHILDRTNYLPRPRLSNVDFIYVLVSLTQPDFSSYLLDKFLSLISYYSIKAGIVLTKFDLLKPNEKKKMKERMKWYEKISYPVYFVNAKDSSKFDFPKLKEDIASKTVAFVGQTGVGKSTLMNAIDPNFSRKVDALYVNSGRGRHTTKEVVLLPYQDGFLFDTPGFSALELTDVKSEDLAHCFPGYESYIGKCRFHDCLHKEENLGCEVKEDLDINLSMDSYLNYLKIMEEVKENDKWKKKI